MSSVRVLLLEVIENTLQLELSRIFLQATDYECFLKYIFSILNSSIITIAISLILESTESVKDEKVKNAIIEIYSLIITKHEKSGRSSIQVRMVQEYLREEHLACFVADFLENLVKTYENTAVVEGVIK